MKYSRSRRNITNTITTAHRSGNKYAQALEEQLPSARVYVLGHYLGDERLMDDAFAQMLARAPVEAFDLAGKLEDLPRLKRAAYEIVRDYAQRVWFTAIRDLQSPELLRAAAPEVLLNTSFWYTALLPAEKAWMGTVLDPDRIREAREPALQR